MRVFSVGVFSFLVFNSNLYAENSCVEFLRGHSDLFMQSEIENLQKTEEEKKFKKALLAHNDYPRFIEREELVSILSQQFKYDYIDTISIVLIGPHLANTMKNGHINLKIIEKLFEAQKRFVRSFFLYKDARGENLSSEELEFFKTFYKYQLKFAEQYYLLKKKDQKPATFKQAQAKLLRLIEVYGFVIVKVEWIKPF